MFSFDSSASRVSSPVASRVSTPSIVARKSSHRPRRLRGFTLVELLVVMAIMGILAAIGISAYGTAQAKARDAKRKSDLQSIARALEMYYNDEGVYPIATTNDPKGQIYDVPWGATFDNGVIYMQQLPIDERFGYFYQTISIAGQPRAYRLFARLENTEDAAVQRVLGEAQEYYTDDASPDLIQTDERCGGEGCNYYLGSTNAPAPKLTPDVTPPPI